MRTPTACSSCCRARGRAALRRTCGSASARSLRSWVCPAARATPATVTHPSITSGGTRFIVSDLPDTCRAGTKELHILEPVCHPGFKAGIEKRHRLPFPETILSVVVVEEAATDAAQGTG